MAGRGRCSPCGLRYTRRGTRGSPRSRRYDLEEMMRISTLLRGLLPAVLFALPLAAAAQGEAGRLLHGAGGMVPADGRGVREGHRHQGADDAQELGRVLRAAQGRGRESARRHLVGRHRRPAPAGGRGRADRDVQVAEDGRAAGLGGAPVGSVEGPHGRRLCRRARLQLQHRPAQEEEHSRRRSAGPISSSRSSRTRSRSPTRTRRARRTRCSRRSCS